MRAKLLAACLAGLFVLVPTAASWGPAEAAHYVPDAPYICKVHVQGKNLDPASPAWAFVVEVAGICPFSVVSANACIGTGDVQTGFLASCGGTTLRIKGTGIPASTPSVVTFGTSWEYGVCPSPACIANSGTVQWTV